MEKKFTIMMLSENNGKHRSVKVSSFIILWGILFCLGLIFVNAAWLTGHSPIGKLERNISYQALVNDLQDAVKELNEEIRQAVLYKQWAEKILFKRINFKDKSGKGHSIKVKNILDAEINNDGFNPYYSLLDIDNVDVSRINLALDFECSFNLINRSRSRKKLSGYLFIVAQNNEVIPKIYSSWPRVELESGLPKDYTKGMTFAIRNLKPIRGRINQHDIGPKFNHVDVIAYSEDGNMIMQKGFYIERLLQESTFE